MSENRRGGGDFFDSHCSACVDILVTYCCLHVGPGPVRLPLIYVCIAFSSLLYADSTVWATAGICMHELFYVGFIRGLCFYAVCLCL